MPVIRSVRLRVPTSHYLLNFSSASISCFVTAGRESSSDLVRGEISPLRPTRRDSPNNREARPRCRSLRLTGKPLKNLLVSPDWRILRILILLLQ
jgi:hypothetical protein